MAVVALAALVICSCNRETPSETTVVFDGRTETITGVVKCTAQPDGRLLILVNQDGGKKTVRVVLSTRGRLVVERVGLRYDDAAGFVADPREVVATKVDDTYNFSGRMPPNPGEVQAHQFEIETACPYIADPPPPRLERPRGLP
jgi:hypothetical protein